MSQSFIVTENFGMSFTGMAPLKSFYPYKISVNIENYTKIAKLIVLLLQGTGIRIINLYPVG
jgi:hypothetical protein